MRPKLRNFLIATLLLLAGLAIAVLYYRDNIAMRVANNALAESSYEVADVSIGSIDTAYVHFKSIRLVNDSGAEIEIAGVSLPLDARAPTPGDFNIESVDYYPGDRATTTSAVGLLDTVLRAPNLVPLTRFSIGQINAPGLPTISNALWTPSQSGQSILFETGDYRFGADIIRLSELHHTIIITSDRRDTDKSSSIALQLFRTESGFSASADLQIGLQPLVPGLTAAGLIPASIAALDANLTGPVVAEIPDSDELRLQLAAQLTLRETASVTYGLTEDRTLDLSVDIPGTVTAEFEYPSLDWTMQADKAELVANSRSIENLAASLTDVRCTNGISCNWEAAVDTTDFEYAGWAFERMRFDGVISVSVQDAASIRVTPTSVFAGTGIVYADTPVDEIRVTPIIDAEMTISEDGWQANAGEISILATGIRAADDMLATMPIQLTRITVRNDGDEIESRFSIGAEGSTLLFGDRSLRPPTVEGRIGLADGAMHVDASITYPDESFSGRLVFDQGADIRHAVLSDAVVRLDRAAASTFLLRWPYPWDLVDGQVKFDAAVTRDLSSADSTYAGRIAIVAADIAGNHDDTAFAGVEFETRVQVQNDNEVSIEPMTVNVALLDVGLPLSDLAVTLLPDLSHRTVQVEAMSMSAFGGQVNAATFDYAWESPDSRVDFEIESIQPGLMVALANFDAVEVEGSMSGTLPVRIDENGVSVDNGRLVSDPPGGVIRYRSDNEVGGEETQLGIVTEALSNFRYESMVCEVNYSQAGDLKIQMRMEGVNPDMDPNQPVILNLGLDNNVPALLRSLQATRTIEDILEKRVAQ